LASLQNALLRLRPCDTGSRVKLVLRPITAELLAYSIQPAAPPWLPRLAWGWIADMEGDHSAHRLPVAIGSLVAPSKVKLLITVRITKPLRA